jgi:hypothetical protein
MDNAAMMATWGRLASEAGNVVMTSCRRRLYAIGTRQWSALPHGFVNS